MTSDSITRDIVINASPETVYDVVSDRSSSSNGSATRPTSNRSPTPGA